MYVISHDQLQDSDPIETISVEGGDGSVNELDDHAAVTMENLVHVSAGSNGDPNASTEANIVDLAARGNTGVGVDDRDDESGEYVVKGTDGIGDDDRSFNLQQFDVVHSPPDDHHYLDTMDQVGAL